MIMKKILFYISSFVLSFAFIACNSGFNQKEAEEILQKSELSATDYDNLLHMYESALDDAIRFSKMEAEEMSEKDREEVLLMFAMGKRLVMDEDNLSDSQKEELTRINTKGKEELTK